MSDARGLQSLDSKPWEVNFSVWQFSVTTRCTSSGTPSGASASISSVSFTCGAGQGGQVLEHLLGDPADVAAGAVRIDHHAGVEAPGERVHFGRFGRGSPLPSALRRSGARLLPRSFSICASATSGFTIRPDGSIRRGATGRRQAHVASFVEAIGIGEVIAHQLADRRADRIDHELPIAQARQIQVGREIGEHLLDLDVILAAPEIELVEGLAQPSGPELGRAKPRRSRSACPPASRSNPGRSRD